MKRKLQAQNKHPLPSFISGKIFILMVFLGFSFSTLAQLTVETDECICLGFPEVDHTGRFEETITLTSNADQIIITGINNFFDITSPDEMLVPYPDSVDITEAPPGMFSFSGLRREGAPWTMIVNEITMFDTIRTIIESQFICSYPDTTIFGDFNNCIGTSERYYVDLDMSEIDFIEWELSGGGTIVGPTNSNVVFVTWGNTPGIFDLMVTVAGIDGASQSNQYCEFETVLNVELVDEESITMACNNEVNLTIDALCEFMVSPDIILRNFPYPPGSFDVVLTDLEADTILNGNMIYGTYVGKRLGVSVIHECSQNSCWGTILLKDELAPPLFCPSDTIVDCSVAIDPANLGFPVPAYAWVEQINFNDFLVSNYDQCGDVLLSYKDTPQTLECDALYESVVERTWTITDPSGNFNTCSFLIYINESEFSEIVFPEDFDDELGTQPSLAACGDWEKLENGAPAPSVTGMPQGAICLNVHVEFKDLIFYKCSEENIDKTFKVWRKWTVAEHCPDGMDSVHVQIISVRDTVAPMVTVPDTITAGTTPYTCGADIPIPAPIVTDCSIWDYKAGYKLKDENGFPTSETFYYNVVKQPDGSYVITDIPGGEKELWVIYTVTDACGNFTTATSELIIKDDEEPVAVCDQYTFVSLDESGYAHAGVGSFNDGSYDNCGIDRIEVRRPENFSCGMKNDWGKKVSFCCADVGEEIMVSLRVVDNSGNSNTCMVLVEVQDNMGPSFTYVPNDTTIQCEDNLEDLAKYGEAIAEDNCYVNVDENIINSLNDCGLGTILREFIATDKFGNYVIDTQVIIVTNDLVLNRDSIDFPDDLILENGCPENIDPDNLPEGYNYPVFKGNGCTRVTWSYKDQVFIYVEGACRKIIREWSVIDWCRFDYDDKSSGIFTDYQVIKINNSTAPTITSCGLQPASEILNGCDVYATILGTAVDDCTHPSRLKWKYEIDYYDDDTPDRSGTGNNASGVLPIGLHRLSWEVTDECGNTGYCDYTIEIEDNKAPSPVCITDLVTVLMDPSGTVDIWAVDFNKGSFDNCGDTSGLYFSFSPDTLDVSMTIDCDLLESNGSDTFNVSMHVIDRVGNYDYCDVKLIIQDNGNVCPDEELIEETSLSGNIISVKNTMIEDVEIRLIKDEHESSPKMQMAYSGGYAFHNVEMYHNYSIVPEKNGPADEGVSTLDLVKIQRHILGIKLLDDPYDFIAADVNNNGSVTAADIIQLRKLILGLYDHFPSNKSWRFVDAKYEFPDAEDVDGFPETIKIAGLQETIIDNDFYGIKIGDVDHSHLSRFNNIQSRSLATFYYSLRYEKDQVVYDIYTRETNMVGFQFSLNFDATFLEFRDLIAGDILLDATHYNISEDESGKINFSWNSGPAISGNQLFTLVFHAKVQGGNFDLNLDHSGIPAEIYQEDEENISSRKLSLVKEPDFGSKFSLEQNIPNPFHSTTKIGFTIPYDDIARINVFDLTGKLILQRSLSALKGYNEISIDASELGAGGVLYYRVSTAAGALSRKMIVINQ